MSDLYEQTLHELRKREELDDFEARFVEASIHRLVAGWLTDSDRRRIVHLAAKYLPEVADELIGQAWIWG